MALAVGSWLDRRLSLQAAPWRDSILLSQGFCSALHLRQERWLCVGNKSHCVTAAHADEAFNATITSCAYSSLYENTMGILVEVLQNNI